MVFVCLLWFYSKTLIVFLLCFLGAVEMNVLIAQINLWRSVAHMSHVGSTSCLAAALLLRLYSLPAGHLRNIFFQINQ